MQPMEHKAGSLAFPPKRRWERKELFPDLLPPAQIHPYNEPYDTRHTIKWHSKEILNIWWIMKSESLMLATAKSFFRTSCLVLWYKIRWDTHFPFDVIKIMCLLSLVTGRNGATVAFSQRPPEFGFATDIYHSSKWKTLPQSALYLKAESCRHSPVSRSPGTVSISLCPWRKWWRLSMSIKTAKFPLTSYTNRAVGWNIKVLFCFWSVLLSTLSV